MQKYSADNISDDNIINGKTLLIDKPLNWTSFDAVKYIRRSLTSKFKIKKIKVGHAGTLDPLASGLLIICIGKQTKKISEYQNLPKSYTGRFKLGESTPSYDRETEVNKSFSYSHINESDLHNLAKKFIGKKMQKPPVYSAIKKDGKRMYEYARKNIKIEIQERKIEIYEFEITNFSSPYVEFIIKCSKGTYIRSIANDFGQRLNSGSFLYELRRTGIGDFSILNALKIQ
ncbi:MAG: tRNA pseudouridine(55) synthase TruB [Flavobacteriales bacterium]|nr:MAG: tRNA pseudouridine(55) synthase TruB [Flavobacteriales bacterium]CAI8304924.1 MAG: tRNA pseudouridine synthase B [Flavobacteriales bacterium]|tara:strand:+ start:793 stop:1482 length:690 start_codon:yes stop_codon:yes gene_type:complete